MSGQFATYPTFPKPSEDFDANYSYFLGCTSQNSKGLS